MSWLSKLFKTDKRDTTYQGPKPYGSLMDAAGGQEYYQRLLKRVGGQDVGYGLDYTNQAANPIIARMRNQFQSYDIPALQSELSVTGRRKGSAGFDQIRRAHQEQGLNEGDVYSQLYQREEEQKRNEINDALNALGDFNRGDYDARTSISNFEKANNDQQVAQEDARRNTVRDLRMRGIASAASFLPVGSSVASRISPTFYQDPSMYSRNLDIPFGQGGSMRDRLARRMAYVPKTRSN